VIEVASHCLLVERIVVRVSAPPLTHALEHGVSVRDPSADLSMSGPGTRRQPPSVAGYPGGAGGSLDLDARRRAPLGPLENQIEVLAPI
jgi:hypothetical protein